MPHSLSLHEAAHEDIIDAYSYYEQQQAGLGERFLAALDERFTAISDHPEYYSYIDNKMFLRDVTVSNFPYVIIYAVTNATVKVYRVYLTYRRPQQL